MLTSCRKNGHSRGVVRLFVYGTIGFLCANAQATDYYVSGRSGSGDLGTQADPWNSVDDVNNHGAFDPGDRILLERGYTYTGTLVDRGSSVRSQTWGTLSPRGTGTASSPITIDAYGTGADPVIDAQGGSCSAGILLYDQEHWIVRNLEVKNEATTDDYRWGILVYFGPNSSNTLYNGITITGNHVRDVYATSYFEGPPNKFYTGGIYVWAAAAPSSTFNSSSPPNSRIAGVLINDNVVEDVTAHGIVFRGESIWDGDNVMNWNNLSTNVVIRDNTVRNTLDGIMWIGTDNALVEHNVVDAAGGTGTMDPEIGGARDRTQYTGAVAAVWSACTRGGVVQGNEVMNTCMLPGDGAAFDFDVVQSGTMLIQYNYSHDNQGGFVMETWREPEDGPDIPKVIVRYNVSENDGLGITGYPGYTFVLNRNTAEIYNNTISTTGTISCLRDPNRPFTPDSTNDFRNNIFHATNSNWDATVSLVAVFNHNCYHGINPPSATADLTPDVDYLTADPELINPGGGGAGMAAASCYKLEANSPCIGRGGSIPGKGSRDFWGTAVYNSLPDIGAYEFPGPGQARVPSGRALDGVTGLPALFVNRCEVTQEEFLHAMNRNPSGHTGQGLRAPLENVTWYDAILYCNARSDMEGLQPVYSYDEPGPDKFDQDGYCIGLDYLSADNHENGYRLPSEAEWQRLYLAGTDPDANGGFYWESSTADDYAWYLGNCWQEPQPVHLKEPNGWDLYDMAGNVEEWVWVDPGETTALKMGGSYVTSEYAAKYNSSAERDKEVYSYYGGFRVVRKLPDITPILNLLLLD